MKKLITASVILSFLSACNSNLRPKESSGNIFGGRNGLVFDSQSGKGKEQLVVGITMGDFIGSLIGDALGHNLDAQDKKLAQQTLHESLDNSPDHSVNTWRNPNNQHQGSMVVNQTQILGKKVCRSFSHTVIINEKKRLFMGKHVEAQMSLGLSNLNPRYEIINC
ncbi:MAG: omp [Francisellaceae bacterium]|nr:omp [Francisellaceae bacterium]